MKAFDKTVLGNMHLENRIGVPPMCTYLVNSKDGVGNINHIVHYATLAKGKPAFITQEATAVNANGYINDQCLGIYSPRQRLVLQQIVQVVHSYGVKIGIQLYHAGIKNEFGNQKYGPMDQEGVIGLREEAIKEIIVNFEFASKWARELGYDFVEVHAAHGYLINDFLTPMCNQREDAYGQDRTLLLRQIIDACIENFEKDVTVRISAEEYEENGLHVNDMKDIVKVIEDCGACAISVSSGGLNKSPIATYPMYQIPFAKQIKSYTNLPVMGVGLITKEEEIEQIFQEEGCDYVLLGRKLVRDPYFLLRWREHTTGISREDVGECMYRALHQ